MKAIISLVIGLLFVSNSSFAQNPVKDPLPRSKQAPVEALKCFAAVNGVEVKGFVESNESGSATVKAALISKYETGDYSIIARRDDFVTSIQLKIVHKASGVAAEAEGWPRAIVKLTIPNLLNRSLEITGSCYFQY